MRYSIALGLFCLIFTAACNPAPESTKFTQFAASQIDPLSIPVGSFEAKDLEYPVGYYKKRLTVSRQEIYKYKYVCSVTNDRGECTNWDSVQDGIDHYLISLNLTMKEQRADAVKLNGIFNIGPDGGVRSRSGDFYLNPQGLFTARVFWDDNQEFLYQEHAFEFTDSGLIGTERDYGERDNRVIFERADLFSPVVH